jgi:glutathione synthase/RimK-type ligase-like ATP-grasp enzyme
LSLQRARLLAANGEDEAAKQQYLDVLRLAPDDDTALVELGVLAEASGHRSAARSAYVRAILINPSNAVAQVGFANAVYKDNDFVDARQHYRAALAADPNFVPALQGLARVLTAEQYWREGFTGHAVVVQRYRGTGSGIPLLLLVAARGGNVPTACWVDNSIFAVTAVYADFHDPAQGLPNHALTLNAIGDADLCGGALASAARIVAKDAAPVINHPDQVRLTGRQNNARRFAGVPDVVVPQTTMLSRSAIPAKADLRFPILLRAPGFHTGQHFVRVESRSDLAAAAAGLPGEELLAIEYVDARGSDGMARKYRAMFIDGAIYPLHLAIGADWKVHYFTAAMAAEPSFREEERCFLDDMQATLGVPAMTALSRIQAMLGLDYAGVDFALTPEGSVLLFEANATMVIDPPNANPIWDYRRPAIGRALEAAKRMLSRRVGACES